MSVRYYDGFWNDQAESVIWINFAGEDSVLLPEYDAVAVAMLSFDKVFVEYRGCDELIDWLRRDSLMVELLRSDAVGLITNAYTAGGFDRIRQTEWLPENDKQLYDLIMHKQKHNLFIHQDSCEPSDDVDTVDQLLSIEAEGQKLGKGFDNILEKYRNLKLSMERGVTVRAYPDLQRDYSFMNPFSTFVELEARRKASEEVASFFGIPHPIRPTPEHIFDFRASGAHRDYRDFIAAIGDRIGEQDDSRFVRGHIIDELFHTFSKEMQNNGRRSFVEAIICTGVDFATSLPIGTAFSIAHSAASARKKQDVLKWRAILKRWRA